MNLLKGKKVFFISENLPMTVMALSENFAVCSRSIDKNEDLELLEYEVEMQSYLDVESALISLSKNPVYTILDLKRSVKGPDNLVLGNFDYFDEKSCEKALIELEIGALEISRRRSTPLNIDWNRTLQS